MPVGSSLCAYSHNLWVNAVLQYQDEGTKLFDIVRPSLLISTDYAQMDLRAISEMKRGQVKDGRALLRWAMGLVHAWVGQIVTFFVYRPPSRPLGSLKPTQPGRVTNLTQGHPGPPWVAPQAECWSLRREPKPPA